MIIELASVTETLIMCVAERRAAGRAYRAERHREVKQAGKQASK